MLQRLPPVPNQYYAQTGTLRGTRHGPWVVNSKGEYELKYLHNIDDWREWAIHFTMEHIARTTNHVLEEADQIRVIEDAGALAEKAWAGVIPLIDEDADMDADREAPRSKISRG